MVGKATTADKTVAELLATKIIQNLDMPAYLRKQNIDDNEMERFVNAIASCLCEVLQKLANAGILPEYTSEQIMERTSSFSNAGNLVTRRMDDNDALSYGLLFTDHQDQQDQQDQQDHQNGMDISVVASGKYVFPSGDYGDGNNHGFILSSPVVVIEVYRQSYRLTVEIREDVRYTIFSRHRVFDINPDDAALISKIESMKLYGSCVSERQDSS